MELLGFLTAAVMPIVVTYLTGYIKSVGTIPTHDYRVAIIRAVVALLGLAGAVLTQAIGGEAVDGSLVETFVLAAFNAGAATWLYFKTK